MLEKALISFDRNSVKLNYQYSYYIKKKKEKEDYTRTLSEQS